MGAKKRRKRIRKMIEREAVTWDDLVLAGVGTLAKAARKDKKKTMRRAIERGRSTVGLEIPELEEIMGLDGNRPADPVISYMHGGGGWYYVDIDGTVVDNVQGEEEAAARAGQLLEAFASLSPEEQDSYRTGPVHTGGGWYAITVNGVPVDTVQGGEAADERMAAIEELNNSLADSEPGL